MGRVEGLDEEAEQAGRVEVGVFHPAATDRVTDLAGLDALVGHRLERRVMVSHLEAHVVDALATLVEEVLPDVLPAVRTQELEFDSEEIVEEGTYRRVDGFAAVKGSGVVVFALASWLDPEDGAHAVLDPVEVTDDDADLIQAADGVAEAGHGRGS